VGYCPTQSLLTVPNVTAHPSTASVPITVLLYDGPLLYGFNVAIKELSLLFVYVCICLFVLDTSSLQLLSDLAEILHRDAGLSWMLHLVA